MSGLCKRHRTAILRERRTRRNGEVLDFNIQREGAVEATTESQVYALTLNVIGDETIRLDTLDMVILVPGI